MSHSIGVILLTPTTLSSHHVSLTEKPVIETVAQTTWQPKTLSSTFREIAQSLPQMPLRLLLSDSLCYVLSIRLPLKEKKADYREFVSEAIAKKVPENLDEVLWDFQVISSTKDEALIQVVVISCLAKQLVKECADAIEQPLTAIEPISVSLNQSLADRQNYILVFQYQNRWQVMVVKERAIHLVKHLAEDLLEEQLQTILTLTKDHFDFDPSVLLADVEQLTRLPLFPGKSWEEVNVSPILNLATKEDISGKDEAVLNLQVPSEKQEDFVTIKQDSPSQSSKIELLLRFWNRIVLSTAIAGLLIGTTIGYYLF